MTERRRFPWGLTIATGIAFLILIGLGTWQVQRLRWKEGVLARISALQAAPARPLDSVLPAIRQGRDVDFTRVSVTCPGLGRAPFVELFSVRDGQAGWRLVSACGDILVDRGFVPDTVAARPPVDPEDKTPVAVVGVLRRPETGNPFSPPNRPPRFFLRNLPLMAATLGAPPPVSYTLMAETKTNPEFPALVPAPIPTDIPNNHLQYAITWYGLAAALLGVYAALLLKRRKD
jgi:surfeit locus 1 family protein